MDFENFLEHDDKCNELVKDVCLNHGLSLIFNRITDGSQLVFSGNETHIIKIFDPADIEFFNNEVLFLTGLYKKLSIPIPHIYYSGMHQEYPYIIMEKIGGYPLNDLWKGFSSEDKKNVMTQLGKIVRELHELPKLFFPDQIFDWDELIKSQSTNILENHKSFKLDTCWLSQIIEYIEAIELDLHDTSQMVPLHTELMLEHIFVETESGKLRICGLIDFEPSMLGHRLYEFCSVGLFLSRGDPELFRTFLVSYGYSEKEIDTTLRKRIMKLLLHHRYCNLNWFMTMLPAGNEYSTLEELEEFWFSC